MALVSGTRFGSYEIGEAIGAGGMGEVYRAHDTTLERDVAIKVLPASFVNDQARVERFEREAKTLASLNHPNIAQIHGLEKSDGTTAIVMELIDGPTLADRIAEGRLSADEALNIAMQIADALEAAHGQGIVHRDLKPANVKVRADGTVKVLDFGIAKAFDLQAASGSGAPALTTPAMTQTGIILGTAAYMSPEQARGKPVDDRTDVWAFGCLLYEMLTGQPAFAGEDIAITLARILANDTDMKSLPAAITPAVKQTIELCLRKDPRKRIADIRDVKLALEGAFDTVTPQGGTQLVARKPVWRRALPFVAPFVTAAIAGLVIWIAMKPGSEPVNRFDYDLPEGQSVRTPWLRAVAISPDGRQFVYNATGGLYLRTMGELEARLIPGTEPGLGIPEFSPDSLSLAYVDLDTGDLKRIAISGGAPVLVASGVDEIYALSWEDNNEILFTGDEGIYRVSANGGTAELIIAAGQNEALFGPRLIDDGDKVLFSVSAGGQWNQGRVVVQSLSTGERTVLVNGGNDARYVPTGHIVYALGDGLLAVRFDADSLTVTGGAVPLVQGVSRANPNVTPAANYSFSDDGTLVYVVGGVEALERALTWVDRNGREDAIAAPVRAYTNPSISPDGARVALDIRDQELDLWIWDFARETLTRLTFDPEQDEFPVWSPDGQRIAFASSAVNADSSLFWRAADGVGTAELLAEAPGQIFPTSFLPDASGVLLYGNAQTGTRDDVKLFRFDEPNTVTPLINSAFEESYPDISPDGRWLAYVSNVTGIDEIYVRPFPDVDAGGLWQVSSGGGTQPLWSSDGSELFYRTSDGVAAVTVQTEPTFSAGNPTVLFRGEYLIANGGPNYDVAPDNQRFLMIKDNDETAKQPQIVIVQNWFEELERLAPTD